MKPNEIDRRSRRVGVSLGAAVLCFAGVDLAIGQPIDAHHRQPPADAPVRPVPPTDLGNVQVESAVFVPSAAGPISNGLVPADSPLQLNRSEGGERAAVGRAFTYQGQLKDGGVPANGTFDMRFTLLDDGSLTVDGPICREPVQVTDGLFTVELDFGTANHFSGENRHLKIEVRPDNTAGNCAGGAYTLLNPPQKLSATPYAQGLVLPYNGIGTLDSTTLVRVFNMSSELGARALEGNMRGIAVGAPSLGAGVFGGNSTGNGVAGFSGNLTGVLGITHDSPPGSSNLHGGLFSCTTANGVGAFGRIGDAYGNDIKNSGVSGYSPTGQGVAGSSNSGRAIYGTVPSNASANYAIFGTCNNPIGYSGYFTSVGKGIYSQVGGASGLDDNGVPAAVWGDTNAGDGVFASTSAGYGVHAVSSSSSGRGVFGEATHVSGATAGIRGRSHSPSGSGVYGENSATTGTAVGVRGVSDSVTGRGVYGYVSTGNLSSTAAAIYGETFPLLGYAGFFVGRGYFSDNVGIGTESPSKKLDVVGDRIRLSNDLAGTRRVDLRTDGAAVDIESLTSSIFMNAQGSGTNNRILLNSASGGNVGIGTPSPTTNLDVSSSASGAAGITGVRLINTSTPQAQYLMQTNGSGVAGRVGNFELWNTNSSTNMLSVQPGGNVGIGTTSPIAKLQVVGGSLEFESALDTGRSIRNAWDLRFEKDTDNDSSGGLGAYFSWYTDANTIEQFRIEDGDEAATKADGTVTSNGIDYAEGFKVLDTEQDIEAGDVVSLAVGQWEHCRRTTAEYDAHLLGIISSKPGFCTGMSFNAEDSADAAITQQRNAARALALEKAALGDDAAADEARRNERELTAQMAEKVKQIYRPIALAGRVPCKVDASFGPIKAGDRLTSSPTPGHAMLQAKLGPTLGIALHDWAAGRGKIMVLVQPGWSGGSVSLAAATSAAPAVLDLAGLGGLRQLLDEKTTQIANLNDRLAQMEQVVADLADRK